MTLLRWSPALLMLLLAASGCRTTGSADPLGLEDSSMLSSLVPQRSGLARSPAGRKGAAASGDPFIQSTAQTAANPAAASRTGRAVISDASADDRAEPTSRDAAYLAAQPAREHTAGVIPVGGSAAPGDALGQAAMRDQQPTSATGDEAAMRQRLQDLEWELQFTDDHSAQEQLALEIAHLRKQLSRSRR